jgi:hypothetical protein
MGVTHPSSLRVKHDILRGAVLRCCRYMSAWKNCQNLWKNDLVKVTENLKDKAPSHAKFEEKLASLHKAAQSILDKAKDVRIDWILVDVRPLARSVHREATELTNAVATAMRDLDMVTMSQELAQIQQLRACITRDPSTLEVCGQLGHTALQGSIHFVPGCNCRGSEEITFRSDRLCFYDPSLKEGGSQHFCRWRANVPMTPQCGQRRVCQPPSVGLSCSLLTHWRHRALHICSIGRTSHAKYVHIDFAIASALKAV